MSIVIESVNKQIYDLIRRQILDRELLPGERIDPRRIAEENNISVMPVRDALRNLTTDGLVVTRERVGFFVRTFGAQEISEIYESRKMFETYCLANHLQEVSADEISKVISELEQTHDDDKLTALDLKVHGMWVYASHNEFLIRQYENMKALFALGVEGGYAENRERARTEHIELLKQALAGNREQALALLDKHLETARVETMEIYSNYKR